MGVGVNFSRQPGADSAGTNPRPAHYNAPQRPPRLSSPRCSRGSGRALKPTTKSLRYLRQGALPMRLPRTKSPSNGGGYQQTLQARVRYLRNDVYTPDHQGR